MQNKLAAPRYGEVDQYERWKAQGGTAYANLQLQRGRQWHQQRRHESPDPELEAVLDGLEQLTKSYGQLTYKERQALLQRDLAEDEHQFKLEEAQFKARLPKGMQVEGLACVYGVVDKYDTRFHPGCFKHLRPSDVSYFFEHNKCGKCGYCGPGRCEHGTYGDVAKITALYEVTRSELPKGVQDRYPQATGGLVVVREYLDTENGKAARWWLTHGTVGISVGGLKTLRSTTREEDGRKITDIYKADITEISDGRVPGIVPGTMHLIGTESISLLQGRYARGS